MVNLDLNIVDSCSLKKLRIVDESDYDNVRIKNASLEITPPGYAKHNVTFIPNSENVYNSITLGITCDDYINLPDGIYSLKYSIYPNTTYFLEKTFIRTELLECKYGKILLNLHTEACCADVSDKLKSVREAKFLIEGAKAAANDCQNGLAYELYNKATDLLNKIRDCEC